MDNLTHALSGVVLSRAGFNRLTPQAGWLMVAAANLPDLEFVIGLMDSLLYLDLHRGPTHALAFAPLLALLPLPLWRWLARRARPGGREWAGAYICSLAAVLSHILFDWLNAYGVRLGLPFSDRWFRLDWLFIVDVWIWLILGASVGAALLARLVYGEIGAKPGRGRTGAWIALAFLFLYIGLRAETHAQAVAVLESRVYQSETLVQAMAMPGPLNPFRWRGLVETANAWRVVEVDLLSEFNPDAAQVYYKPDESPALQTAKNTPAGQAFLRFAQAPVWRQSLAAAPEGATTVTMTDLRFGDPGDGRFSAKVLIDASGGVIESGFQY
ncbi:MAG: metal-dependent hydrolase [Bryobacteraceae bacterium]|nr:metal-dependent hydrolase [Bryobacteraceae bacterium]